MQLPHKDIGLTVSCDAPVPVAFRITDNRAGSRIPSLTSAQPDTATDAYNFGLGTVKGKNVGGFSLVIRPTTQADGNTVPNIWSGDSGKTWQGGVRGIHHQGQYFSFGDRNNNFQPTGFRQLTATLVVRALINKPENMTLTDDVPLDGSATLEMVYL